jgi:hypothetical protein
MVEDYTSAFRSEQSATRYDKDVYSPNSYDTFIGRLQASWLRDFVREEFRGEAPTQHDFACGTGRIIEDLNGLVREAHGYDTSPDMLALAEKKGLTARFHQISPGETSVMVETESVDSVILTMFRLLLNSPESVRDSSLRFAAGILRQSNDGVLIVNNHGNRWSVRHLARLGRRREGEWFHELSTRDVRKLAERHGLLIERCHGFGILPRRLHAGSRIRPAARWVDRWAARKAWLAPVSIDIIYTMRLRDRARQ